MSNPLVSVIIPVYNAENFIEQTIQSVLNQTIQDFEIIVLNDGSKDNSGVVIQALQKKTIESFTFQNQIAAFRYKK
ncbi:MAG: glycosyltransferase [Chitinophagaceae bacterium]